MQYKSAQSVDPIRLPYHKIKEFYNLAPEKYEFNYYDEEGVFTYVPSDYMLYEKEHIMGDSYISWLRSLRLIKQIKNNRITAKNNVHVKDYLQCVLKDAQALQVEAQKQMGYVLGEMQKSRLIVLLHIVKVIERKSKMKRNDGECDHCIFSKYEDCEEKVYNYLDEEIEE